MGVSSRGTPPPPAAKKGVGARLAAAVTAAERVPESKVEVITADEAQPPAKRAAAVMGKAATMAGSAASAAGNAAGRASTISPPRLPSGVEGWLLFAGFVFVFSVTTQTTHDLASAVWPGVEYWKSVVVQLIFFAVERRHFKGGANGFTWAVLGVDSVITALGLFMGTLPRLFATPQWQTLSGNLTWLQSIPTEGAGLLGAAVLCGVVLAWTGDKLYDMSQR